MKCPRCQYEIPNPISAAGGKRSKRAITPDQQAAMQRARASARAVRVASLRNVAGGTIPNPVQEAQT